MGAGRLARLKEAGCPASSMSSQLPLANSNNREARQRDRGFHDGVAADLAVDALESAGAEGGLQTDGVVHVVVPVLFGALGDGGFAVDRAVAHDSSHLAEGEDITEGHAVGVNLHDKRAFVSAISKIDSTIGASAPGDVAYLCGLISAVRRSEAFEHGEFVAVVDLVAGEHHFPGVRASMVEDGNETLRGGVRGFLRAFATHDGRVGEVAEELHISVCGIGCGTTTLDVHRAGATGNRIAEVGAGDERATGGREVFRVFDVPLVNGVAVPRSDVAREEAVAHSTLLGVVSRLQIGRAIFEGFQRKLRAEEGEHTNVCSGVALGELDGLRAQRGQRGLTTKDGAGAKHVGGAERIAGSLVVRTNGVAGIGANQKLHEHVIGLLDAKVPLEELRGSAVPLRADHGLVEGDRVDRETIPPATDFEVEVLRDEFLFLTDAVAGTLDAAAARSADEGEDDAVARGDAEVRVLDEGFAGAERPDQVAIEFAVVVGFADRKLAPGDALRLRGAGKNLRNCLCIDFVVTSHFGCVWLWSKLPIVSA